MLKELNLKKLPNQVRELAIHFLKTMPEHLQMKMDKKTDTEKAGMYLYDPVTNEYSILGVLALAAGIPPAEMEYSEWIDEEAIKNYVKYSHRIPDAIKGSPEINPTVAEIIKWEEDDQIDFKEAAKRIEELM